MRRSRATRSGFTAAVALASLAVSPPAGSAEESYSYTVRLGSDTLSLESVTRTASQVRGGQRTVPRRALTAALRRDGRAHR